jgi:hypothetical protein
MMLAGKLTCIFLLPLSCHTVTLQFPADADEFWQRLQQLRPDEPLPEDMPKVSHWRLGLQQQRQLLQQQQQQ